MTDTNKDGMGELARIEYVLRGLWLNWAAAFGAITLPLLMGLFVPRIWLPFICLIAGYFISAKMRSDISSGISSCSILMRVAARVLLLSAAAMFVVVILCTDWLVPTVIHLDLYNSEIPFVTCLVIFPIVALCSSLSLLFGLGTRGARDSQRRNGLYAGDSIVATLYYRDSKYQLTVLLFLSLSLGAVEYWYYFARYINTDLNNPDRFFFNYLPITVYVLSLLFMTARYRSLMAIYTSFEALNPSHVGSTIVRFLIFRDNDLLLRQLESGLWDTPAETVVGRCRAVPEHQAEQLFHDITGIENATFRYCYTNDGFARGSNMVHYAVFTVDKDIPASLSENCTFFNAYMLDSALRSNSLSPTLANELYRIHTITMAWKTYDRRGRRLYPVKNYRPTFRFADLSHWKVDYDDASWFDVAANNEDRPFFHTRRLWNRITGIFTRSEKTETDR